MSKEQIKRDILEKIRKIAAETGEAPGQTRFASLTGVKEHVWRGKFWRSWSEALVEAGFRGKNGALDMTKLTYSKMLPI